MTSNHDLIEGGASHCPNELMPSPPARHSLRNAKTRSVETINRLCAEMEEHLGAGARGSVYAAYQIGLVVKKFQDAAPRKHKTAAIERLAAHPDIRLSKAQLYRYLGLVKKLPEALHIDSEKFLTARKNEFLALIDNLTLSQAWKLIGPPKPLSDDREELKRSDGNDDGDSSPTSQKRSRPRHCAPVDLDDHWLTPTTILECARKLLGKIDNDPCGACETANQIADCRTWTPIDSSLVSEEAWSGRLFLHPPVSNVQPFLKLAVDAIESGKAIEALVIIPAEMDAAHMAILQPFVKGFFHKRPLFTVPSGEIVSPSWPFMLVFLTAGAYRNVAFAHAFGHMADIYFPHQF